MNLPYWWNWELEFTPHTEKRMFQRGISEIELRQMFDNPLNIRQDIIKGRWIVESKISGIKWRVIIEPDIEEKIIVIVTVYFLD